MKLTFTFLIFIFASLLAFSQAPNAMSYQAVIRDANNNLVSNQTVGMQISILQGSASGSFVYTETQTASTNANGLVSVVIGEGTTNDNFSNIDWANGLYFIKTETDPTGGNNYTITGTSQLLSVPYALYVKTAENKFSGDYDDLSNKPNIPTVPSNVSAFTNDAGYVTTLNDDDPTNELQNISLSATGDTLYLSNANWIIIPTAQLTMATLTTASVSSVTDVNAISGGNITNDGGSNVTARGVVWSTSQNPTLSNNLGSTANGTGTGTFTSNLTGLTSNTTYYVRAYATNNAGTGYGNELSFTTTSGGGGNYPAGTVHCTGTPTVIVDVTNPTTGKTWMDRNLGASQAATSSTDAAAYGDLYQWGRAADGHQCRNSGTTTTLSSTDQPGHGDFIISNSGNYDWRSPQNDNLWQGVNGTNNPCPSGYRLPTSAELDVERLSWSGNNAAGAILSPLKLSMAGSRRNLSNGSLEYVGVIGNYWSSMVNGTQSNFLSFQSTSAFMSNYSRANGYSVRCLKD